LQSGTPPVAELDELLAFAHGICDEADALALRYFDAAVNGSLAIDRKPDATLVTRADREIEELLRARIADRYPQHVVLGEEYGDGGQGEWRWIIDPIDATHNFVRGVPVFATLLALERSGELVLGVVSAAAQSSRWFGVAGGGARLRDARGERVIHVSAVDELAAEASVLTSTIRGLTDAGFGPAVTSITARAWRDRGFGDFWGHVLVAQGAAEAMLEYGPAPWDLAAPFVVLREAGGRMTDFSGRVAWSGPQVLSSNGLLHDELLRHFAR
jgi:histidinol-phosphatase